MTVGEQVECRRAIEALRAGVPNRDAVLALGCDQPKIEQKFIEQLKLQRTGGKKGQITSGMLVEGGFGAGKSHLMEYLMHLGLNGNFVCSRIVISKETPLYDPVKFFRAAIESARVPDKRGDALTEVATKLSAGTEEYRDLYEWINRSNSELNSQFAASLFLYERMRNDPDLRDSIISFWSGEPFNISDMRRYLRKYEGARHYKLSRVMAKELALQRFKFATRLMIGAGYSGWILFVDEAELVGRYSFLQRARAYKELARWMGRLDGERYPGLSAVFAITDDFVSVVLEGKKDLLTLASKIRNRGGENDLYLASSAEQGMQLIQNERVLLKKPDGPSVRATLEKVISIHGKAYAWEPPQIKYAEGELTRKIRTYVKGWITELDLRRLDPNGKVDIELSPLTTNYGEDEDLQAEEEEE